MKIKEGEGDGCAVSLFKVEAWGKGGGDFLLKQWNRAVEDGRRG